MANISGYAKWGSMNTAVTAVTAVLCSLLLAPAAWGQTTSTSTSFTTTTTTVVPEPPNAFISASSGEVRGEIRFYCWTEGAQTVCADRFGPIDPAVALSVRQGELLTLRFDRAISPTSIRVRRSDSPDPLVPATQTFNIPAGNPTQFAADFPPGTWFVSVFTLWGQNDAEYVFELTVSPSGPTSTTSTTLPPTTSTSTTVPPSGACNRLRQLRAPYNAQIDAAVERLRLSSLPGPPSPGALARLEATRAQGNAIIDRALVTAGCEPS